MEIKPGQYLERDAFGDIREVSDEAGDEVDARVCRQLADFPGATVPRGGELAACRDCGNVVVFDPTGPVQDAPKVCFQCAGFEPLPFPN